MVKGKEEVISQFNILTNMSVDELEAWLKDPTSKKAGTGVGLESAEKIIGILKKNPSKDPEGYDEEDIEHMRKVVSYDKRHMAQEDHLKETKSKDELENAKSTISLKNWGHDPLKEMGGENGAKEPSKEGDITSSSSSSSSSSEEASGAKKSESATKSADEPEKKIGDKRKLDEQEKEGEEEIDLGITEEDAEGEEEEQEGRARKKSKTDGEPLTEESVDATKDLLA